MKLSTLDSPANLSLKNTFCKQIKKHFFGQLKRSQYEVEKPTMAVNPKPTHIYLKPYLEAISLQFECKRL